MKKIVEKILKVTGELEEVHAEKDALLREINNSKNRTATSDQEKRLVQLSKQCEILIQEVKKLNQQAPGLSANYLLQMDIDGNAFKNALDEIQKTRSKSRNIETDLDR